MSNRVTRTMLAVASEVFAIAMHGDGADQDDANYYAPMIRVAFEAALIAREEDERRLRDAGRTSQ